LTKNNPLKNFLIFTALSLFGFQTLIAQKKSKIIIDNADFAEKNENLLPGAALLTGNVRVNHQGIVMTCNKAYYFETENYIKAFGNVQMVQGDTLYLNSKYAEYNGEIKQAFATGDVVMRSPESTLVTDTINFDRNLQEAFYRTNGTITNNDNILKSKSGRYFAKEKKFHFETAVTITNPKYVVKTNNLNYYTNSGHSYLFGPSTITSKKDFIYTENGFYNTKKNTGHFLDKSYIKYNDRRISADSLYFDRAKDFASGTRNVKITDSINKAIIKGHYGEIYKQKDSLFITKHAVAINLLEKDSVYIHAKKMLVTGPEGNRIIRAFSNARFYKKDMSGKCDSIHSNQKKALTQLIGKPIMWNLDKQITGEKMHLIGNNNTEKLDSLKVLNAAFMISKDTIGLGFNQVKGQNLYGKFRNNKMYEADVVKNTEVIFYMRNDKNELIGINKNLSSKINMTLADNKIETITFFKTVDGDIYPEKDLPENARKLRGFLWRGEERILTKEDIFPPDEKAFDEIAKAETKANNAKPVVPMPIRKETLEYDKKKKHK
jgi:lipopolysaccharide assembly outer membrane protein LptD (OstA)